LKRVPPGERVNLLVKQILAEISEATGRPELARASADTPLLALGIDSMVAVELAASTERALNTEVPIAILYDSTVAQFAAQLLNTIGLGPDAATASPGSTRLRASAIRLEDYVPSDELAGAATSPEPAKLQRTVLLTGATGFVGRFLALELLARLPADGKLICLVRAENAEAGLRRLRESFGQRAPEALRRLDQLSPKLEVVAGDLSRQRLGVDAERYGALAEAVDGIVHAGALVNHALPYESLYESNVLGTATIMRFALARKLKHVHFVSSAVVGESDRQSAVLETEDAARLWPERDPVAGRAAGYATTKWLCEVLLDQLHERTKIPLQVFRCGMVLASSTVVGVNRDDYFTRLLSSIVKTGCAPQSFYPTDRKNRSFTGLPVDFIARALAAMALAPLPGRTVFHVLNSPGAGAASLDDYTNSIASAGYSLQRFANYDLWFTQFRNRLLALDERERRSSALPLIETWVSQDIRFADFDSRNFLARMRSLGIELPAVDEAYIHRFLAGMATLGLIPPPPA
jgi:fatty acid CoA ligase FadD9